MRELTAQERKQRPLASGVLDYFPDALMEVAYCSWKGNEQHNPGEPLHWAKEKSTDEPDALLRHLKDRGTFDSDGVRHSAKVAWRALAMLQREIEAEVLREIETPPDPAMVDEVLKATVDEDQHRRNRLHQEEAAAGLRRPTAYDEARAAVAAEKPHEKMLWKGQHPVVDL